MLQLSMIRPIASRTDPLPEEKETVIFEGVALTGMEPDTLPITVYTGFEWESEFDLTIYMDLHVSFREATDVLPAVWQDEATTSSEDAAFNMHLWWQS